MIKDSYLDYANLVINKFSEHIEILLYKENFKVINDTAVYTNVDRSRKFIYNENGILVPKDDSVKIFNLTRTLSESRKRGIDNVYGYCLCNNWDYFITLTFDYTKLNGVDYETVKYCWKLFRQKMQYYAEDIKIFLIPELHKSGLLHFHGFLGNCNFDKFLQFATNNKEYLKNKDGSFKLDSLGNKIKNEHYRELLRTKYGDIVYNFKNDFYNFGYTTVVKIRKETSKLQITNYLTKYISKEQNAVGFNKKSYFRTYNLNFKNKEYYYFDDEQLKNFLDNNDIELNKNNDKFISFIINKNNVNLKLKKHNLEQVLYKEYLNYKKEKFDKNLSNKKEIIYTNLSKEEKEVVNKIFLNSDMKNKNKGEQLQWKE